MRIKKLFKSYSKIYHMVIKTVDNRYMYFLTTPARNVVESDLFPCPYYQEKGRNAEEAQDYFYKMYGFEKVED